MNTKRRITVELELPAENPDMIGLVALRRVLAGMLLAYRIRCIDIIDANNAETAYNAVGQTDAPLRK